MDNKAVVVVVVVVAVLSSPDFVVVVTAVVDAASEKTFFTYIQYDKTSKLLKCDYLLRHFA